jgi:S1-C subfamily serine protease
MPDFDDFNTDEADLACPVCGDPNCPGCEPSMQKRLIKLALIPLGVVLAALLLRGLIPSSGADNSDLSSGGQEEISNTTSNSTAPSTSEPDSNNSTASTPANGSPDWDTLARSVVFIEAAAPCEWRGSGTIVLDGSYILTNQHVASNGECKLIVGLTKSLDSTPQSGYFADVLVTDSSLDLAVLRLIDASGIPAKISGHEPVRIDYSQPPLGTRLSTLGYPALGSYRAGMTITFTSGTFSGIDYTDGEFFKTDAQMRGGVSGGAAFNENGLFIGVPTGGLIDEDSSNPVGINLIRPVKYAKPLLEEARTLSGK